METYTSWHVQMFLQVKESDRAWINYIAPKCHAWKSLAETQGWIQSTPSYNNSGFYIDTSAKIFTTRLPRPNGEFRLLFHRTFWTLQICLDKAAEIPNHVYL